ncbi:37S ribosomal protein Mrp10, mitochondrial [Aspergillus heteromorphus CBS 117.55]|uniref:Small ribosomal subunit protein mS37 n=1 Tax=Aspergillus heteromorphus CBS 117.55 TaxID=1448321 RepID=A0A317WF83_9EURO|nr:37S ribosomal protein Mrp10, mitochondrial [Aspergillus heteromorphus CBS 117.55]PWY82900.1 37S ribosomal protein Mrp10, mitochondrial [Aspergillus heteromorphus CBS 117.55]
MPAKAVSTRLNGIRLQSIGQLRVKAPNKNDGGSCTAIMSSMLSCWASQGYTAEGCGAIEQQLRQCMDAPKSKNKRSDAINYHLSRMYPKVVGPKKKKGVIG